MRRTILGASVGVAVSLVVTAAAWACVAGPTAFLNPSTAQPGTEVEVRGVYFTKEEPVQVRFNALDGPVLGTFTPAQGARTFGLEFEGKITVPPDAKPGNYVLVFTQYDAAGKLVQAPPRLLLTVAGPNGATPVRGAPVGTGETDRPTSLVRADEDPLGAGALLLIGLGTAGLGMFAAGMAALMAGRRRERPQPAAVRG